MNLKYLFSVLLLSFSFIACSEDDVVDDTPNDPYADELTGKYNGENSTTVYDMTVASKSVVTIKGQANGKYTLVFPQEVKAKTRMGDSMPEEIMLKDIAFQADSSGVLRFTEDHVVINCLQEGQQVAVEVKDIDLSLTENKTLDLTYQMHIPPMPTFMKCIFKGNK